MQIGAIRSTQNTTLCTRYEVIKTLIVNVYFEIEIFSSVYFYFHNRLNFRIQHTFAEIQTTTKKQIVSNIKYKRFFLSKLQQ